ncbi:hypothetical protein GCM10011316_16260 [Roseibium aquae]|uniref:Uncharacterized protein n=1 Tax=Roseibium aquae TaxID=1323746 RepID=A0A916WZL9_9HYPH|nr:hypothetical protein [Roseibium aquae]GGB45008.1 hypothetical protein GCM10011316_16260 [Roseibium aquae]
MLKRSVIWFSISGTAGLCLPALAAGGDYYIRSEVARGQFSGFHEILPRPKEGYFKVNYCDRTFWVSDTTVLWTEREAAAGRRLVVEAETRSGRDLICADAHTYVNLDSLGLPKTEIEVLRDNSDPQAPVRNRLRIISEAFKDFK